MLRIIELDSWSHFEKIIEKSLLEGTRELRAGPSVYRGHANAAWHLETTLERAIGLDQPVSAYFRNIERIQLQIETFVDRNLDFPTEQDYANSVMAHALYNKSVITYLQYLRHFGYPSPLLDWSYSPFVAAYFAFRDVTNKAESVAIYELLVAGDMGQLPIEERARIYPVYASARRNKRHYLQQSFYTVCYKKINGDVHYASHEDPSAMGEKNGYSGEPIIKYILPAGERVKALHSLEAYNINSYSLMGTEESLLETLFLQAYKSREISRNILTDQFNENSWW
ncbi:MAG: FRG domain-containing protein [Chloroflexota bacterium]